MAEVGAPRITDAFAEALKSRREWCNTLFAAARAGSPNLDPEGFGDFLAGLAPLVPASPAESSGRVVEALFEIALEVVSKELVSRHPEVVASWKRLLFDLPGHPAQEPRLFAGAAMNALYNLAATSGARPEEWAGSMVALGQRESNAAVLLEAGKVAAWRAGMAHYRMSALERCLSLPEELALAALGLPEETTLGVGAIVECLRADPWLHPRSLVSPQSRKPEVRIVGRVGGFRGFGGTFLRPPTVYLADGHLAATDGEASWLICADVFGATLHRAGGPVKTSGTRSFAGPLQVGFDGTVRSAAGTAQFGELSRLSSAVSDATTLAVTVPLTHAIYLVAESSPS